MSQPIDDDSCFLRPAPVRATSSSVRTNNEQSGDDHSAHDAKSADSSGLKKRIVSASELVGWQKSVGYQHLISFVKQLNHFATGKQNGVQDYHPLDQARLVRVRGLLQRLSQAVDEVKPFVGDKNQRFGNKAFRLWFERMRSMVADYLKKENADGQEARELGQYLLDSFGNCQRIDYGTGHELNFVIFLMGLYKLRKSDLN